MQKAKYVAIGFYGEEKEIRDDYKLYQFIKKVGLYNIGHTHNDTYLYYEDFYKLCNREYRYVYWVIVDKRYRVVPKEKLLNIKNSEPESTDESPCYKRWVAKRHDFIYRRTPVPFTGARIRGKYGYHRSFSTTNERRQSFACDKKYVRAKRNCTNIPNAWDDFPRSLSRSWKDNTKKRKQWMK